MNKLCLFAIGCSLFIACKQEIKPEISEIMSTVSISRGSTFEHQIAGCTIDPSFENTCTDWILFRGENKVDYLVGGGDIIFGGDIVVINDSIKIYNENTGKEVLNFLTVHLDTLLETNSGEKWARGKVYDLD